jgi:hypothetical protein
MNAMGLMSWLGLLTGAGGAAVAIYGGSILLTGRLTRGDQRAFRRTKEAGLYYLCFGLALTLLVLSGVSNEHHQSLLVGGGLIGTLALAGLAVIRYRPRQDRRR